MMVMESPHRPNNSSHLLESVWQEIEEILEAKKARLYQEIVEYPLPIPACDAQYNYLLEQRALLSQELRQARDRAGKIRTDTDALQQIHEFIAASAFIDAGRVERSLEEADVL